jgi:hypothetical protein
MAFGTTHDRFLEVIRYSFTGYLQGQRICLHRLFWGDAGVTALLPILYDAGLKSGMTVNALSGCITDG